MLFGKSCHLVIINDTSLNITIYTTEYVFVNEYT